MTGVLGLALSWQGGPGGIEQLGRVWEEEKMEIITIIKQ